MGGCLILIIVVIFISALLCTLLGIDVEEGGLFVMAIVSVIIGLISYYSYSSQPAVIKQKEENTKAKEAQKRSMQKSAILEMVKKQYVQLMHIKTEITKFENNKMQTNRFVELLLAISDSSEVKNLCEKYYAFDDENYMKFRNNLIKNQESTFYEQLPIKRIDLSTYVLQLNNLIKNNAQFEVKLNKDCISEYEMEAMYQKTDGYISIQKNKMERTNAMRRKFYIVLGVVGLCITLYVILKAYNVI